MTIENFEFVHRDGRRGAGWSVCTAIFSAVTPEEFIRIYRDSPELIFVPSTKGRTAILFSETRMKLGTVVKLGLRGDEKLRPVG